MRNFTLHFTSTGTELKPFDKRDGLAYQMDYDFDPEATTLLFQKFLERVLPDATVRKLIFQYVGYVFLRSMNLEKILFLYGGGANGKSVFLNVIRELIGREQCCSYPLEDITKSDYHRAVLGNYLFNVSTEISTRMGADIFKKIASREPLSARHPYGKPFVVNEYATSVFAMNSLPRDVELTDAFFRRFIIIPFDVRIPDDEQDPDLAKKIVDSEMPGVLNLVIEGVKSLLAEGKFDIPKAVQGAVEIFQKESDTVLTYMEENEYSPSVSERIPLREMYASYKDQHPDSVRDKVFSAQLRKLGYVVKAYGRRNITVVYATRSELAEAGE